MQMKGGLRMGNEVEETKTEVVTIENVQDERARNGSLYCKVFFDGKGHNCWDGTICQALKTRIGKRTALVSEKKKGYWNITGLDESASDTPTVEEVKNQPKIASKDELIISQTLTKCVSELLASGVYTDLRLAMTDIFAVFEGFKHKLIEQ